MSSSSPDQPALPPQAAQTTRQRLMFFAKLALSVGIVGFIYYKVTHREGAAELWRLLADVSWGWLVVAFVMQMIAALCSVTRWRVLLVGQGIHAPFRHLFGSFMIGRFFGEFAPGGWTGLNGYRLYDIAKHTGKVARSTATIGIEMVLGWLAFGAVVVGGSFFGLKFLGWAGVLLVDAAFLGLMITAIALVSKPLLFRALAKRLPRPLQNKLRSPIDAVCAYEGKGGLVTQAALLGIGTHTFRGLIYVCAARALNADLGIGEVFFGTSLQIFVTMLPITPNGIGLREATAVALYTSIGVPSAIAVLIPTLGFLTEVLVSSLGGLVFMARRVGYTVDIKVDHPEREQFVADELDDAVPPEALPRVARGAIAGLTGGVCGGVVLGVAEAAAVLQGSSADADYGVLAYGAAAYGLFGAVLGTLGGAALALSGRMLGRRALPEPLAVGRYAGLVACVPAIGIAIFRIRRDVFHETLAWKSVDGVMVLGGTLLGAALLYLVLSTLVRVLVSRKPFSALLRVWASPVLLTLLCLVAFAFSGSPAGTSVARARLERRAAPAEASSLLVIVVDTLRADHLPAYGGRDVKTPNLDALAKDGLVFEHHFANASWTRPSFASILTGRYPASHRTTLKSSSLPDAITTLPEALQEAGYTTLGIATNYNVAPFFNFHQGFDAYRYLEPDFVLGANDTAAKLLLVQFARQRIEKYRAQRNQVEPGSAYQDATVVNTELLSMLEQAGQGPFFAFVGYMDPHDPYYPHPYDGTGYSRAANPHPKPEEAPALIELYNGEIAFWDEEFGKLVAELKKKNLYDDMTIVITSDHGEEFMEHGGFWHGTTLYDEQLRVPMIVKLPKNARAGTRIDHWTESVDILPSLLKWQDIAIPEDVQGKDLMLPTERAYAEEDHEGNVLKALRMRRGQSELKIIEANAGNPRGLQPLELYRVDQDPGEKVTLAHEEPEVLRIAVGQLEQRGKVAQEGAAAQQNVDLASDSAAVEKLRALGYAGGEKKE
jgi:uncharacterized protein (TIRG00374 family)